MSRVNRVDHNATSLTWSNPLSESLQDFYNEKLGEPYEPSDVVPPLLTQESTLPQVRTTGFFERLASMGHTAVPCDGSQLDVEVTVTIDEPEEGKPACRSARAFANSLLQEPVKVDVDLTRPVKNQGPSSFA